jgi:hypothetical protein
VLNLSLKNSQANTFTLALSCSKSIVHGSPACLEWGPKSILLYNTFLCCCNKSKRFTTSNDFGSQCPFDVRKMKKMNFQIYGTLCVNEKKNFATLLWIILESR